MSFGRSGFQNSDFRRSFGRSDAGGKDAEALMQIERMKELVEILNRASKAYYQDGDEIMSNLEYDKLYDELQGLERETGIVLSASPTERVGYELLSELPKVRHLSPMLSLDKTKSPEALAEWLGDREGLLSWKLDGLTIVLNYEGGELVRGVTRGNGEIGELVTQNVRVFDNVPTRIPFSGSLVLRGEALIRYSDFERINDGILDAEARYKNPRNLCAGSVRQLDPGITKERHVKLLAFSLVSAKEEDGSPVDFQNSRRRQFEFLREQGFSVVEYRLVRGGEVPAAVKDFSERVKDNDFPSDGLVLLLEDIAYGESLGRTAKFPRNALAFKWRDEEAETVLREVEWSPSRTGLINPVAIFDPVELEGTTVSRASLHNLSFCEELSLGLGDRVSVYKANMIIPQLSENFTKSGTLSPPSRCPACGEETEVRKDKDAKFLYCKNPDCPAKRIKKFSLFVSRDALNIEGLSEMTLEKFIGHGFIKSYRDLYHLERHREEILSMEGFGERSYERLMEAVEKSRDTLLYHLIYGLGIDGIGLANARLLCGHFHQELSLIRGAKKEELLEVDGIGEVLAEKLYAYFHSEKQLSELHELLPELRIGREEEREEEGGALRGKTIVITGNLTHFENRKELEEEILRAGGKCSGSVSKKTSYLVNNDSSSQSGKSKKAKELGIPIVTEEEFLRILGESRESAQGD